MAYSLLDVLVYAQMGFAAFCVIFYLITPKEKRHNLWEIGWLFILGLVADVVGLIAYYLGLPSLNITFNLYGILSVPLLLHFYKRKMTWSALSVTLNVTIIVFLLFGFTNLFFIQTTSINSYTHTLGSVLVFIAAIIYTYHLVQRVPRNGMLSLPDFWINVSLLIMYLYLIVFFAMNNYLLNVLKSDMVLPLILLHCVQLVYKWIIWIAFWLNRTQPAQKTR